MERRPLRPSLQNSLANQIEKPSLEKLIQFFWINIKMVGLQYHCHCSLLHCHLIQTPKLIALPHHPNIHMQEKGLKLPCPNQRLIKGKKWPIPLTLLKIPLNQYPPIFTSNKIAPMSSTRSILKVPINLKMLQKEKQQEDQKRAVVERGKPTIIENMDFDVVIGMVTTCLFWKKSIYLDTMFWTTWILSYFWSIVIFYIC